LRVDGAGERRRSLAGVLGEGWEMCRIAWAWLSGSLCLSLVGCAAGDSTMGDISGDPGIEVSLEAGVEASSEASAPPYMDDAGRAGNPAGPDAMAADSWVAPVDSGHVVDAGRADAALYDATEPVADASPIEASPPDTGIAEAASSPDSEPPGDVCPSGAQYAVEAAAAAISGAATFCPTGSCPAGQCCYEQLMPASVCVAR
jgi:hypothetical protein